MLMTLLLSILSSHVSERFSEGLAQVFDFSNQPLLHTMMMIDDDDHHDYHHHHEDVGDIELINIAIPGLRFSGVFTQHDAGSTGSTFTSKSMLSFTTISCQL